MTRAPRSSSPFAGPVALFVAGVVLTVVTLLLAYWGVPTALFSALTAWCFMWTFLPPRLGMTSSKWQLLLGALVLACLGTWLWLWLWT